MDVPENLSLLTIDQVADALHVHPQTVRGFFKRGELDYVKVGKFRHVAPDQLARYIDEHRSNGDG